MTYFGHSAKLTWTNISRYFICSIIIFSYLCLKEAFDSAVRQTWLSVSYRPDVPVNLTSCENSSCTDHYVQFPAFSLIPSARPGCEDDFSFLTGTPIEDPERRSSLRVLLDTDCIDYQVPSFVSVSNTSTYFKKKCETCALVSSSGRLLDSGVGPRIDSAECVLRMNNAPIGIVANDVGSRTTIRLIAHSSLTREPSLVDVLEKELKTQNVSFLVWDPTSGGKLRADNTMDVVDIFAESRKLQWKFPRATVYYGTSHYFDHIWRHATGSESNDEQSSIWLSTGLFSVVTALHVCNQLDVYAFAPDDFCVNQTKGVPYHYYPNPWKQAWPSDCHMFQAHQKKKTHAHRFLTEQKLFREWAQQRNIRFHVT